MVPRLADLDAVIFDMDGVIIDSEPLHERTARMVFQEYDMTVPEDLFDRFKGRTDREIVRYMIEHHATRSLEVDEILNRRRAIYASVIHELEPVADVLPFIHALSRTHRLAVATSASRHNQQLAFSKFALDPLFEFVIAAEDITRHKPDPEPYRVAAARLGADPSRCLVFEDSTAGVRSALGAGCQVIAITTTFPEEALRAEGVQHVASGFAEIREWLMPG